MRILVSGDGGFISSSALRELLSRGRETRLISVAPGPQETALIQKSDCNWTIVRPGPVYGPGDELVTPLVKMMRSLPAVPRIKHGDDRLQPIWHEDLARALANAVERDDLGGQILEVAGDDTTTIHQIMRKLEPLIDRNPLHLPFRSALKLDLRVVEKNALSVLGVKATPLDEGLARLLNELPEQLAEEGFGALSHKRFFARISGSRHRAAALMTKFRDAFTDIIPLDFKTEPQAVTRMETGSTLTMALPLRGNAQVRVEALEPTRILLLTIEGHPLSGAVQFSTSDETDAVVFAIDTYTRSANKLDWIAMHAAGGAIAQDANWRKVVQKVIDLSGGSAPDGVRSEKRKLDASEAMHVEKLMRAAVNQRNTLPNAERAAQYPHMP